jgi:CBS domain-containing protein
MNSFTVDDVMTKAVAYTDQTATYRTVVDLLIARRVSAVPVMDAYDRIAGVVSEVDLLRKIEYGGNEDPRWFDGPRRRTERAKALARTAADLMTAPAVTIPAGASIAATARQMDLKRVKRLPVVDELGRLVGIVTRSDLLKVHLRPDDEVRADIERILPAGDVRAAVEDGVVTLSGKVPRASQADEAVRLARQVPGVVEVSDELAYDYDDRPDYGV